jgi:hypothetical protein
MLTETWEIYSETEETEYQFVSKYHLDVHTDSWTNTKKPLGHERRSLKWVVQSNLSHVSQMPSISCNYCYPLQIV